MAVYGGVTGVSKQISDIYIGVDNAAKPVTAIYAGVNNKAVQVFPEIEDINDYKMFVNDNGVIKSDGAIGYSVRFMLNNDGYNEPIRFSNNGITSLYHCLGGTTEYDYVNFNQPVIIPNTVTNARDLFTACHNFNQPVTIPDNVYDVGAMFYNCSNFNQPIAIPSLVKYADSMLRNTKFNYELNLPDSLLTVDSMLADTPFNQPVTVPEGCTTVAWLFSNCAEFNQAFTIPNTVTNCRSLFHGCTSFNRPITIPDNVTDCCNMFKLCTSFKQRVYIPATVTNMTDMFANCTSLPGQYIYINGTSGFNPAGMIRNCGTSGYIRIFCNNIAMLNKTTAATSITGNAITWSAVTNGYYNATQRVYIYSNYSA